MFNRIFSNSRRVPVGKGEGRGLMEDLTVTCSKPELGLCQLSLHLHAEQSGSNTGIKAGNKRLWEKNFPSGQEAATQKWCIIYHSRFISAVLLLERRGKKK